MTQVQIVATGTANVASVIAALRRLGAEPMLVRRAADVRRADRLVLPGVGAFGAAMATLARDGVSEAVRSHATAGKPLLAICLGMQLLAEWSEESPGVDGLGVIPGGAVRLPGGVRVPQLGWNTVRWVDGTLPDGDAYFANSFCLGALPSGWQCATSVHGQRFVSAIRREAQLACQFHPELSGEYGARLLEQWWSAC
jgi:imidazole glycerol phosphate synthase glutamine amidotransferase subunit